MTFGTDGDGKVATLSVKDWAMFRRAEADAIVHLAAQPGVRHSVEAPHACVDANVNGFLNVLEGARAAGVRRVVYASSSSVYGDLTIDNASVVGQSTVLPSLGSGVAQSGSHDAVLVTDRTSIAAYFVGHWVEVSTAGGVLKGTWRIASLAGGSITLQANGSETISIEQGDRWAAGAIPAVAPELRKFRLDLDMAQGYSHGVRLTVKPSLQVGGNAPGASKRQWPQPRRSRARN